MKLVLMLPHRLVLIVILYTNVVCSDYFPIHNANPNYIWQLSAAPKGKITGKNREDASRYFSALNFPYQTMKKFT